ncbi:hypothetical protein [Bradyrhizobium sp. LVM 105]|uniref:hypothetical protein n=1 Tax=Bradyrhizobium sp. LVM 105 TaxID=2341115 RepID=UPI000F8110FD|nr:hypothetical protein [Bradyrhizobium sp. LVM 105]RTE92829.1 hypothetical protein D6B98_15245 [Bradyrhizobium sp. LVM 105]
MRKLVALYQEEPLSRWQGLRYATQANHRNLLGQIERRYVAQAAAVTKIRILNAPVERRYASATE